MAKEYPAEDQTVETPHCLGCKNYKVVERINNRPSESCLISGVEINNKYIAKRSSDRCPLGKGKYNGKSRNNRSELFWARPRVSGENRPIGDSRTIRTPEARSERNSGQVVPEEREAISSFYDRDYLRARREEGVAEEALAGIARDMQERHGLIPQGHRVYIPQMPTLSAQREYTVSAWSVPEHLEFTWDGERFRRTR